MIKLCLVTDWDIHESGVEKYKKNLKRRLDAIFQEDFLPESEFQISILASKKIDFILKDYFASQNPNFLKVQNFKNIENEENLKDFFQDYDALILIKDKMLGQLAPKVYAIEKLGKYSISFDINN